MDQVAAYALFGVGFFLWWFATADILWSPVVAGQAASSKTLWLFVVMLLPGLGPILYLLTRRSRTGRSDV